MKVQEFLNRNIEILWTDNRTLFVSTWFVRLTYLFAIVKVLLSWPISLIIVNTSEFTGATLFHLRLDWITENIHLFLISFVGLLVFSLFRSSYIIKTAILIFGILYFRIHISIINGSDAVLLGLFCFSVLIDHSGKNLGLQLTRFLSNTGILLAKVHLSTLYFVSGMDKLMSPAWQTGKAINYLPNIDYLFNPHLASIFPTSPTIHFLLSWIIILFEVFFFLAWFNPFRKWILIIGTLFHLSIAITLSLPDFGLVMIIYYVVFLVDQDLVRKKSEPTLAYT